MWIKTFRGELYQDSIFGSIYISGPFTTRENMHLRMEDLLTDPLSKEYQPPPPLDIKEEEKFWAIAASFLNGGSSLRLCYGTENQMQVMLTKLTDSIKNKAHLLDIAECYSDCGFEQPSIPESEINFRYLAK